jgi:hypothetical protein
MISPDDQIAEIVHRETRAWDTQDVELLLSIFHPDMVWPWPPHALAHDPAEWIWGMGRFDAERWRDIYRQLFDTYSLVHNRRNLVRISISPDEGGAFAVVDVDTLWRTASGEEMHWFGRACKVYALVAGEFGPEWKMTMHTGLLVHG